jgi:hypothetical protein
VRGTNRRRLGRVVAYAGKWRAVGPSMARRPSEYVSVVLKPPTKPNHPISAPAFFSADSNSA